MWLVLLISNGIFYKVVVYFDQGLGAAHSKRWSKYAFLNLCQRLKKGKKAGSIMQNWAKKINMMYKYN